MEAEGTEIDLNLPSRRVIDITFVLSQCIRTEGVTPLFNEKVVRHKIMRYVNMQSDKIFLERESVAFLRALYDLKFWAKWNTCSSEFSMTSFEKIDNPTGLFSKWVAEDSAAFHAAFLKSSFHWMGDLVKAFLMAEGTKLETDLPLKNGFNFILGVRGVLLHERRGHRPLDCDESFAREKLVSYALVHASNTLCAFPFLLILARFDPDFTISKNEALLEQSCVFTNESFRYQTAKILCNARKFRNVIALYAPKT